MKRHALIPLLLLSPSLCLAEADAPKVQIAILLDTSNSMDGLIAQAKTQLWTIVNEFNSAEKHAKTPRVEVALYEYGNDRLPSEKQHLRQVLPFTNDLDALSRELFALRTQGGSEFCGAVTMKAVNDLTWSEDAGTYRAIFIAGNEPYTQGPVDAEKASLLANKKGLVINTIHCGTEAEGRSTGWKTGADYASGKFFCIDQTRNEVALVMNAPQDEELQKLNLALNATYLPFGKNGWAGQQNQTIQDGNAQGVTGNETVSRRILTKSSSNYSNGSWDAVDAVNAKLVDITALKPEELPECMRQLKAEERMAFVREMEAKRKAVQADIVRVGKERDAWLAAQPKPKADPGHDSLQSAVRLAIREQAQKLGYLWK